MFVYSVKPNAIASGGCAIVAAGSANEALRLVNESNETYRNEYVDLYAIRLVHLESDLKEPKVITDCIYLEEDV